MPSFATEVKNELARLNYEASCCRTAELAALLRMGSALTFGLRRTFGLNFTTENAAVARKALQLLKAEGGGIKTEITVSRSKRLKKNNSYTVQVPPAPAVAALLEHLGFLQDESLNMETDSAILKKNCCRVAYLRADRKDSYIVYLKEGDAVIDFLAMLEAEQAVEAFEVARNVKEVREQVNRLVNCETANLQKAVDAAGRQLAEIKILAAAGLEKLSPKLRAAAEARLENPEASLAELAEMLGITKSGMSHRMRKLGELARILDKEG